MSEFLCGRTTEELCRASNEKTPTKLETKSWRSWSDKHCLLHIDDLFWFQNQRKQTICFLACKWALQRWRRGWNRIIKTNNTDFSHRDLIWITCPTLILQEFQENVRRDCVHTQLFLISLFSELTWGCEGRYASHEDHVTLPCPFYTEEICLSHTHTHTHTHSWQQKCDTTGLLICMFLA